MTPIETVQAFISAWKQPDTFQDSLDAFFTSDCLYQNIGLSKTRGPDEAKAFFREFAMTLPFATIDVDMLAIASTGDSVLTERIDHLKNANGQVLISIPLMGIFRVSGDRIYEWRDYFDTAPFTKA